MSTDPISRVAYFSGEALLTADFQDEQTYHKQMRERLSQGLFAAGIVEGLDVEWNLGASQVTVRAGKALDRGGRLIVLTEDAAYTPPLVDGKQNYLTISYGEVQADLVTNSYGVGYKRWIEQPLIVCKEDYDPDGPEVLLAVIAASGGAIQSIYYQYGRYMRRRVSAVLQSVEFVDGSSGEAQPVPMSIAAMDQGKLKIEAPHIELNGAVTADTLTAGGNFTGTFNGSFEGDGSGLKNVPVSQAAGYWARNEADGSLFYTEGNVGVNDAQPSAVLSVGQPVRAYIGTGLVTAVSAKNGIVTLQGYQTNFTDDLVGKILQFGVVLKQEAAVASVEGEDSLTLANSFPLGLGPTKYGYISVSSGATDETPGAGLITPNGTTVKGSGGTQFQSQAKLQVGDVLVIDRFVPQQKVIESKILSVDKDSKLTLTQAFSEGVTDSGYLFSTEPGRWTTGEGTISSTDTNVTGVGTTFTKLPDGATLRAVMALDVGSAPQTWRVDEVTDSTHLTMHKISIDDGTPLLPMMSSFVQTTWPLMRVGGGVQPAMPPALTVVQNNGSVPNTVAVNVDDDTVKIDSSYALQVNGPVSFAGGSLDINGGLDVDGDLLVTGTATIDQAVKAGSDLTVDGNGTFERTLTVKGSATMATLEVTNTGVGETGLKVDGVATIKTLEVTNTDSGETGLKVDGAATIKTLEVTNTDAGETGLKVGGAATIKTLEVTNTDAGETGLKVDGAATIKTLEVTNAGAGEAGLKVDGSATINTLEVTGASNLSSVTITQTLDVDGVLTVGTPDVKSSATINGALTVTEGIFGSLSGIGFGGITPAGDPISFGSGINVEVLKATQFSDDRILMLQVENQQMTASGHNYRANFKISIGNFNFHVVAGGDGGVWVVPLATLPVPKNTTVEIKCDYSGFAQTLSAYVYFMQVGGLKN